MDDCDSDDMESGRRKVARGAENSSVRNKDDSWSLSAVDTLATDDDAAADDAGVDRSEARLGIEAEVGRLLISGDAEGEVAGKTAARAAPCCCCCWYCCLV